jgi:hypothetical protein
MMKKRRRRKIWMRITVKKASQAAKVYPRIRVSQMISSSSLELVTNLIEKNPQQLRMNPFLQD